MTLVLPCINCRARTMVPPNAAPMLWWPRHTPRIGSLPAKCPIAGTEMPASAGNALQGDRVVAKHLDIGTEFAQVLDDDVGEAVVVVDHQESHAALLVTPRFAGGACRARFIPVPPRRVLRRAAARGPCARFPSIPVRA